MTLFGVPTPKEQFTNTSARKCAGNTVNYLTSDSLNFIFLKLFLFNLNLV